MSAGLRIALLTHSVLPRGGVVHTLELAEALTARGHAVTVVAPAEPGQRLFREVACRVALVAQPRVTGPLVEQVAQRIAALEAGLPAVLRAGRFELLHAQDSLSGNALATLAQRGPGLPPWVRTVHHLDDFSEPTLAAWQERAWRAAHALACVSDTWCERMRHEHGVAPRRMFNGVNLAHFTPAPQAGDAATLQALGLAADGAPLCLAVGGIEQRKNSLRLLRAFAHLRATDAAWSGARLVMAGGASLLDHGPALHAWSAALRELGLDEGPQAAVWRTGPLPDAVLPALMRRARLLALPSLVEGFGLVALEALACGTPVLVSDRPPFTEHLAGCPAVAWCDPLDERSVAAGLRQAALLPRPPTPPRVCLEHGWMRSAALHEAWYREVLRPPTPADAPVPAPLPLPAPERKNMPAMHYTLRWPDASETVCYSPSLVIQDYFQPGQAYALESFMAQLREATAIANERVRAKFGFACSRADDQLSRLETQARRWAGQPGARVEVLGFGPAH